VLSAQQVGNSGSGSAQPSTVSVPVIAKDDDTNTGITYRCTGGAAGECTFDDTIRAADRLLKFGRNLALLFSVVVIAYAGYLYMLSGDDPGKRKKANEMLLKVVKGIVIILAASLFVRLIVGALLPAGSVTFI
jgi:hypothetical protein